MGVFRSQSPRAEFPAYPPDILCPYPGFSSSEDFNFQSFSPPVYAFLFTDFTLFCKQTFVNEAQNILKVIFYSKGSFASSSTFTKPSLSFFGWIRFQERWIPSPPGTDASRVSPSRRSHCPSDPQSPLTAISVPFPPDERPPDK